MSQSDPEQENPSFFVTRRGRQVGVHEVDLNGIDIDSDTSTTKKRTIPDPVIPKTTYKSKPTGKPDKNSSHKWSKRKVLVITGLLILITAPFVVAEIVTAQYRSGTRSAKTDLQKIVDSRALPAQKKSTIAASAIGDMADEVNGIVGSMCRGGLLDNVAGLYPRANVALGDCKASQSQYASLARSLYALESEVQYLEQLEVVVKPVTTPITDEYAAIGAQQAAWQTASESLKKISPPSDMKAAHAELQTHINAVASAWSSLNTANNEQNATGFSEAEATLATEYEAVRTTSGRFNEVIMASQALVLKAYSAVK